MSELMEYKGQFGSVKFSPVDRVLYGKLEYIRSSVSYDAVDVESLVLAFHDAVDRYLAHRKARGLAPEAPFSGTFQLRPGSKIHRDAALRAREMKTTLNNYAKRIFERELYGVEESDYSQALRKKEIPSPAAVLKKAAVKRRSPVRTSAKRKK